MNTIALPRTASAVKLLTGDRVILGCILLLLAIALLDTPQLVPSLKFTGAALLGIAPFLLLAVGIAALAKATGADAHISRAFAGNQTRAVMGAALVGAFSPFCSCGVIPPHRWDAPGWCAPRAGDGVLDRIAAHGSRNVHSYCSGYWYRLCRRQDCRNSGHGTHGGVCGHGAGTSDRTHCANAG